MTRTIKTNTENRISRWRLVSILEVTDESYDIYFVEDEGSARIVYEFNFRTGYSLIVTPSGRESEEERWEVRLLLDGESCKYPWKNSDHNRERTFVSEGRLSDIADLFNGHYHPDYGYDYRDDF